MPGVAMTAKIVKLYNRNGGIFASSLDVARDFGKRHAHVLDAIVETRKSLDRNLGSMWFRDGQYYDPRQRLLPCIDMTRQGWSLVVMGFTGAEAMAWKVAYILKFDEMEEKLGPGARTGDLFDVLPPKPQVELPLEDDDADDTNARHLWNQRESQLEAKRESLPVFKRNAWIEQEDDATCMVTQRDYPDGAAMMMRFVSDAAPTSTRLGVLEPNGKRLLICVDHVVPLAVVLRCYARLGRGPMAETTLSTLRHYLAR